jgi:hypothetical protein
MARLLKMGMRAMVMNMEINRVDKKSMEKKGFRF